MPEKNEKLLARMHRRFKLAVDAEVDNRKAQIDDLKFSLGGDNQWDSGILERRRKRDRPVLTIDLTNKFIHQVTNDIRHNTPEIKVSPASADADPDIARHLEGIVRDIQYRSKAGLIYTQAGDMVVRCGRGAWRLLTRYVSPDSFEQEIYLAPVKNPFAAFLDSAAREIDRSDAAWGFIIDKLLTEEFEEQYPKAKAPTSADFDTGQGLDKTLWFADEDTVTVAGYFERVAERKTICLMSDGSVLEKKEAEAVVSSANVQALVTSDQPEAEPVTILREREAVTYTVKHYVCTATEVIEEQDWPGQYIPLFVAEGEVVNVEGKDHVTGLINRARDAQSLYNYWNSELAEAIALAPKATWLITPKQIENFEVDYAGAHTENFPYLKFNPDPDWKERPHRVDPPAVPAALLTEVRQAEMNVENTLGMFKASVGAPSNETSGRAIRERKQESDVGTFHFIDNLSTTIEHCGRVIQDLIPHIYDTERDVTVRGEDGSEQVIPINTTARNVQESLSRDPRRYQGVDKKKVADLISKDGLDAPFNHLGRGKYAVRVSVGPSYTTQREEAYDRLLQFAGISAKMNPVDKYFVAKNLDCPGADEYVDALKKTLPPGILPPEAGQEGQQAPPPPPSPEMMLNMAKLETQKLQAQVQLEKLKAEQAKAQQEAQLTESGVRSVVIQVLKELHAPPGMHPADQGGIAQGGLVQGS
jgi:hypothetical protein